MHEWGFRPRREREAGKRPAPSPHLCSGATCGAHPRGSQRPETPLMSHDQQYPHESELSATAVQLNHTAVYARDRQLSAEFIAAILGLKVGAPFGPFLPVDLG